MADEIKKPEPENSLQGDAVNRRREARRWKETWVLDFKECYFFAAPHRQREVSSQVQPTDTRRLDYDQLLTDFAFELCTDFTTEIINTFMPEAQKWCEFGPGMLVPPDVFKKVQDEARGIETQISDSIKASNLYAEMSKGFTPDLAIGTPGLWIEQKHPAKPISVLAIPLRELDVTLGPDGQIDDRFVTRYTRNCYVKALLPAGLVLPPDLEQKIKDKPQDKTEIAWGFWRIWDEVEECWQHTICVKDQLVHSATLRGEGSCPVLVPRFNPSPDWPWGVGPLIQGLPSLRQMDELEGADIEAVDRQLRPPITYPDDSFTNIEQGLESGMAYPIRPGTEGAVKSIYEQPNIQPTEAKLQQMRQNLRRIFFIDFPEQTGDTPPTLGQWLDEMARAQRRIGTPGMSFWREGPAAIFLRFKFLLEKAGVISPIKVNGTIVGLLPRNPAQRAAEQQEIATAFQYMQAMAQTFPEEFRLVMDGKATMEAFATKMRVAGENGLIKFRSQGDMQAALQQISQLAGLKQQARGPAPAEGSGAPAAA